jgi:hypothetical protein
LRVVEACTQRVRALGSRGPSGRPRGYARLTFCSATIPTLDVVLPGGK